MVATNDQTSTRQTHPGMILLPFGPDAAEIPENLPLGFGEFLTCPNGGSLGLSFLCLGRVRLDFDRHPTELPAQTTQGRLSTPQP